MLDINLIANSGLPPTVLDVITKSSLLFILICIVDGFSHRASAAFRHRLWCLAFIGALAIPVFSMIVPEWRLAILPAANTSEAPSLRTRPSTSDQFCVW